MGKRVIAAVDLFYGAGGLTYGLRKAGISVVAGIDLDPACEFPFTSNNGAQFIRSDVSSSRYAPARGRSIAGDYLTKSINKVTLSCNTF